jgi:hypothetical protein
MNGNRPVTRSWVRGNQLQHVTIVGIDARHEETYVVKGPASGQIQTLRPKKAKRLSGTSAPAAGSSFGP